MIPTRPTPPRPSRAELLGLLAIVLVAAVLRLPGLETRGVFDADQGHDMLVLLGITRGEIPLLGPPTSIGTFHHGAVYYYLLAPAVLAFGADPVAVMGWIALFGVGAVAATWWLGRLVGGPVAAVVAGVLAAVSPAGIDESTFIWNPNLIPVASALAFAAAIHGWQARSPRWWLLAGAGAMVTMQCHVLGVVVLPPLVVGWLLDVRRARREAAPLRGLLLAGGGAALVVAAGYVPLLVNELTTGWSEVRGILDYVAGGGRSGESGFVMSLLLVALRSLTWPLVGLITASPALALVVGLAAILLIVQALRWAEHRGAALGLLATFAWATVALALFAPGLAVVIEALPNDHYHAFLDPIVLALTGAGIAAVAGVAVRAGRPRAALAWSIGATGVLAAIAFTAWPPAVAPDGGWASARRDAAAVRDATGGGPFILDGIPALKSTDSLGFPLALLGVVPLEVDAGGGPGNGSDPGAAGIPVVLVCDPVLEEIEGRPCGGAAEAAWLAANGPAAGVGGGAAGEVPDGTTLEGTGPRRVITIYGAGAQVP
ncbi:MAG TPA: glycosyltransferase family 39 protein [Candidatus Limnocylindrales bacterium]|nr:glycosyltransferase family 39 protein [Candidatus Limnocylindrales bacterium]